MRNDEKKKVKEKGKQVNQASNMKDLITIGELSRMTGIAAPTLRIWEKRYGRPAAHRLPSGHRRYPREEVSRLKAIAQALDSGYRAGKVVCSTLDELKNLLGFELPDSSRVPQTQSAKTDVTDNDATLIDMWIDAIKRFDERSLTNGFHEEWNIRGPFNFVLSLAAPLIYRIGTAWECGEITIAQEHFASERLERCLSERWQRMSERREGPRVLLTTLPGDLHRLGLQMCAVITALTGARVMYLGPDTPVEEIVRTASGESVAAISISIAPNMDPGQVTGNLTKLRKHLDSNIEIAVGGTGAPSKLEGINIFDSFKEYYNWICNKNRGQSKIPD